MHQRCLLLLSSKSRFVLAFFSLILLIPPISKADTGSSSIVRLIKPKPDTEIIDKRPEIVCDVTDFYAYESILVLLDGADMTGIINMSPEGFSFQPIEMLQPGAHVLQIILEGAGQIPVEAEFSFSSRHTGVAEKAFSKNDLSAIYSKTIEKEDDSIFYDQPSYTFESNLSTDSAIREGQWESSLTGNVRYLTQNLSIEAPLEKGFNLANYLVTGSYNGESCQAKTEIGDVNISETQNTINLARRGGTFAVDYHLLKLKAFTVNSEEVFGFRGGTGIDGTSDEHIRGVSGELRLFSDKVNFKTIYAGGGEKGDSYSTYTVEEGRKGNVLGFLLSTNFFENKLNTEAEFDFSKYDADTADEFSYEDDKAYKLGVNGLWGPCSYGAVYEYFGPDYQVIGNPYLQSDLEGASFNFGVTQGIHSATLSLSQYNDNVDKDSLYARTDSHQGQVSYTFTGISSLPINLAYQRSELESSDEPEYFSHMENTTDVFSGTVSYALGAWNIGFQAGYSEQNDKTLADGDTDAVNYGLSSSYYTEYLSISPSVVFNRSRYEPTSVRTDTATATLDLRGNFWDRRILYECAGTYTRTESSDDAIKQDIYNTNFRIAYMLSEKIWGLANPSAGFMGYYNTIEDYVYNTRDHDFTLLFVFSTSMPFVL